MNAISDLRSRCDRVAFKLHGDPDQYSLLDMATVLMLVAAGLEQATQDIPPAEDEPEQAMRAIASMRDCLTWVREYGPTAPMTSTRDKLDLAWGNADSVLASLEQAEDYR